MALISIISENIGPTVGTVNASTYGFGLGVGALLGLLVVLQLSVTDKRIRTRRKLTALVGEEYNLGTLRPDRQDSWPGQLRNRRLLDAHLCRAFGGAIVSTSANLSGQPPARNEWQVRRILGTVLDDILVGQSGPFKKPSEIRDAMTGHVIRQA